MIETSLTTLLIFNLVALLAVLAAIWLVNVCRERARERRQSRWRVVCPVCGAVFEHRSREQTLNCPACTRTIARQRVLDI